MFSSLIIAFIVIVLIVVVVFWAIPYLPLDGRTADLLRGVTVVLAAGYLILKLVGYLP